MTPLIAVSDENSKPPGSLTLKVYMFFRGLFDDLTGGSANFLINFARYIYLRIRYSAVVTHTLSIVFIELLSDLKDTLVAFMFWGRSPFYRIAVQVAAVVLVGILGLIQFYRKPQLTVTAQTVDVESIEVAENDLLVETGSTQTQIPKSRGRLDTITHVVQSGETVSGIAKEYNLEVSTILWANGLTERSVLKNGQELRIPEGDGVLHRVAKGDSLDSIAKKYESNGQSIAQINWIDDPSQLPVGEVIFVPNGVIKNPVTVASKPRSTTRTGGGGFIPAPGGGQADPGPNLLIWPVAGGAGSVTQCPSWHHKALDIASRSAPNIVAARSGTVLFAGVKDPYGYGREVVISHGNGLYTQYAHLSSWAVRSGQQVSAGQIIGRMGRTGLATGIHLHFEVRIGGSTYASRVVNPQRYVITRVCR